MIAKLIFAGVVVMVVLGVATMGNVFVDSVPTSQSKGSYQYKFVRSSCADSTVGMVSIFDPKSVSCLEAEANKLAADGWQLITTDG